jgi:hypothetical protein
MKYIHGLSRSCRRARMDGDLASHLLESLISCIANQICCILKLCLQPGFCACCDIRKFFPFLSFFFLLDIPVHSSFGMLMFSRQRNFHLQPRKPNPPTSQNITTPHQPSFHPISLQICLSNLPNPVSPKTRGKQ